MTNSTFVLSDIQPNSSTSCNQYEAEHGPNISPKSVLHDRGYTDGKKNGKQTVTYL
jgi:hypothetical protein